MECFTVAKVVVSVVVVYSVVDTVIVPMPTVCIMPRPPFGGLQMVRTREPSVNLGEHAAPFPTREPMVSDVEIIVTRRTAKGCCFVRGEIWQGCICG